MLVCLNFLIFVNIFLINFLSTAKRPSLANLADVNLEPEDCIVVAEQNSYLEAPTVFPEPELFCGVYESQIENSETQIFTSFEVDVPTDDEQIKSYINLEYPAAVFTPEVQSYPEVFSCGNYEPRGLPELSEIANSGPDEIMIFTATEDVMQPGLSVSPEMFCTKNELKPYLMILNEYEESPVVKPKIPIVEAIKDPPKPTPKQKPISEVLKRKRELNRVASANCKRRKIETILKLEENVRDIEDGNSEMEQMIEKLKKEVYDLEFELAKHVKNVNCPIEFVGNRIVMN